MAQEKKRVLIVDDTMVDRMILKSILEKDFRVMEADSGNRAFEYITTIRDDLDAILLDLSMPHINGFDVLSFMKEKDISDIPVFVVTSETTKVNVQKAFQYDVSDFIKKPFDKDDVLGRLRSRLGIVPEYNLTKEELLETTKYIADLESIYKTYLANFGKSDARYKARSDLMHIMLNAYRRTPQGEEMNQDSIMLISKAAYFCDIGEMLIPEDKQKEMVVNVLKSREMKERHTVLGSNFIRLNRSNACRYFVEICASMCLHHHERYDGRGYPYGIKGDNNSIFNQICRVLDELEERRSKFYGDKVKPIKYIIGHLVDDGLGVAGKEVYDLLEECEPSIFNYYL
ncbi:MAG: response regulator [Lachnospiraceae bacterium]|nr:response regulator [Lachnospiraceae bacterium]